MIRKKIFGSTWTFKTVAPDDPILLNSDNTYSIGVTLYSPQRIFVSQDLAPDLAKATLRHEIAHVIIETMVLGKGQFNNEEVCDFAGTYAPYITALANRVYKHFKEE